ncbi:ABC-three component system protein [Streptomyces sp. NPDC055134]
MSQPDDMYVAQQVPAQPSQAEGALALTVVAPALKQPASLSPKQMIYFYSPDQFEEFVYEWARALKHPYVGVDIHGGSGDHGVDVAAYLTPQKLKGDWHSYQCKHYGKQLALAAALPEMLKVFTAVIEGHYVLPSRYVFVAPSISRPLVRILATPDELKRVFLGELTRPKNKVTAAFPDLLRQAVMALARSTDFSMFEAGNLDDILDLHRTTRHWAERFHQPLPLRPAVPPPPDEHDPSEARYIRQLLDVYTERFGDRASSLPAAREHKTCGEHLRRQREAFFSAEWLRMYARESVPEGYFEALQKDVYDGVIEVADRVYPMAWERVQAVLESSVHVQLTETELVTVVRTLDRKGVCHQLANEDQLTWCQGDEA